MITVAELLKELEEYPADALVYAYEGERTGIVIVSADRGLKQLGFIPAKEEAYTEHAKRRRRAR